MHPCRVIGVAVNGMRYSDEEVAAECDRVERELIHQGAQHRTIVQTLDKGWELLRMFPRAELTRVRKEFLERYYPSADGR